MARRLNTYVHVHVDGVSTAYGPGDKIPKAVAKLITAPDVWEDDGEQETPPWSTPDGADQGQGSDPAAGTGGSAGGDTIVIPKKNESTDAWRAYADAKGFETDPDISRAEIIAALEAGGIPTE